MLKTNLICFFILLSLLKIHAQGKENDIPVSKLPTEVKSVLESYLSILSNASSLEDCASKFVEIAGGSLVNEEGNGLRSSVQPYSLKKDFENCKFYKQPLEITRVNASFSNGQGFGASAIKGMVYKIWINKTDPKNGLPAPVSIMVPEGHSTIKEPKVVVIGSL